jgi:hypothetical protein
MPASVSPSIDLPDLVHDIADALLVVDADAVPFKAFQPGVGPYGEPQLAALIAIQLRGLLSYHSEIQTKRTPDLLIPGQWALELKLARPFGDNGREAENWSVNLLHPYPGNVSAIGDCLKLQKLDGPERRAAVVIGYEHAPTQISLEPLFASFEVIARSVIGLKLGQRVEVRRGGLRHPVHQQAVIAAWEVL